MISMWFLFAILSAVLWGMSYALAENLFKNAVSPSTLLFFYSVLSVFVYGGVAIANKTIKPSIEVLLSQPRFIMFLLIVCFSYMIANLSIFYSVQLKNATIASMIEMSYPVFTAFFTWLFFREVQINPMTMLGFFCVVGGIVIIQQTA